jgi:muramoyltetrapeptide carboxypeptidase
MTETRIRLIAPSGYPHDRAAMTRGVERLRAAGCTLGGLEVLDRGEQRYAGSDIERAGDLNALATLEALPDIALAIRGGYGATRLLDLLHYDALRERLAGSRTLLVGHSDFTALQLALHAKSGLCTFSGPMLGADFGAPTLSGFTWDHFWETVRSPATRVTWSIASDASPVGEPDGALDVEGPLWGGNLAVLCSLVGTPYFPVIEGGILFVEDVGEPPFRIERLLYQLHLAGVLGRQRALLLGDFSQCRPSAYDNGYGLADSFRQIRVAAGIPVFGGLPVGHEPDKLTLPFGAPARLRVSGGTAQLDFSGYPHLRVEA